MTGRKGELYWLLGEVALELDTFLSTQKRKRIFLDPWKKRCWSGDEMLDTIWGALDDPCLWYWCVSWQVWDVSFVQKQHFLFVRLWISRIGSKRSYLFSLLRGWSIRNGQNSKCYLNLIFIPPGDWFEWITQHSTHISKRFCQLSA